MIFEHALRRPRCKMACAPNVTSLVDIMLVLVLYATYSYATQAPLTSNIPVAALPAATDGHTDATGLHVTVMLEGIRVEDADMIALESGALPEEAAPTLALLRAAMQQTLARERLSIISEESLINQASSSRWLYLDAVHNIPYTTIEAVTRTARAAGLAHFRLMVHAQR